MVNIEISNTTIFISVGLIIITILIFFIGKWTFELFKKRKDKNKKIKALEKARKVRMQNVAEKKDKPEKETFVRNVNPLKYRRKKLNVWYIWERLLDRFIPHRIFMINMEMANSVIVTFLVRPDLDGSFKYGGKRYLIDSEKAMYNRTAKNWVLHYNENITVPFKNHLNAQKIKESYVSSKKYHIEQALNPSLVEKYVKNKVTEGLMRSNPIIEFLNRHKLISYLTLTVVVIHFLLFIQASGLLKQLNLPV